MSYIPTKDKSFLELCKTCLFIGYFANFFKLDSTFFLFFRNRDLIERLTRHLDFVADTEEAVGPFLELDEGIGGTLYSNAQFTCTSLTGVDIEDIYKTTTGLEKGAWEYNI